MHRKKIALLVAATLTASNAQAFWGVGDVTYDPSSYSELLSIFGQLEQTYQTTMDTYRTMSDMEATLRRTYADYEEVRNINLSQSVKHFNFRGIETRISDLGHDLTKVQGMADLDGYQQSQLDNIGDLKRLQQVQQATDDNASTAAAGISKKGADVITAQSTAALASFAAETASDRRIEDINRNTAAKIQADSMSSPRSLIQAIKH